MIVRNVRGGDYRDAMGPYPIFSCGDWGGLEEDLRELGNELVAVALVVDPFGNWTVQTLERCFPDMLLHFKDHFVVELGPDPMKRGMHVGRRWLYACRSTLSRHRRAGS